MKSIDRGKITASFCMGTKKLYDYINDNPLFSFRPTEYINDANVIGKHKRMIAVNMALEIDLTGQVCSDSVGGRFYSGIGGQIDFNRGAARSESGRAIITLPSLNKEGDASRIVCTLQPGSGVVINRASVHYVVTEYGVAYLHGKSIQERVMALISIAHPDFREQLFREAVAARGDFEVASAGLAAYPGQSANAETVRLLGRAAAYAPDDTPAGLALAIGSLILDDDLREAMGRGAEETARERFQWEREKASLLAAYERLMPGPD